MQKQIKQLRIRFVLIVLLIVTLMMGLIFGAVCHFMKIALEDSGYEMLQSIATRPAQFGRIQRNEGDIRLPYFVLEVDQDFAIISSYGGYYDLSDTESIESALALATVSESDTGYIEDYGLRYLKINRGDGIYTIAFADVSSQSETMSHIYVISMVICGIGILLFTLIGIILSYWAIKPVQNSWNQQKQFVSDASHELKTPLTVITTNAEMLQMPECSEEDKQKYTNNIVTVSHQMRGLVEDLLNLARVEKGEVQSFETFVLSANFNEALMQFEPVMFELGFNLVEEIQDNINVKGSPQRLGQLLTILLDNAAKYSKPGDITVNLRQIGRSAVLNVSNPADPLTDQQLKDIFKRFYRTDESHNQKGSYGLGLSIAQSICEAHNGKIHAEYKEGIISFIATIPCV